jgi:hypothetical protein
MSAAETSLLRQMTGRLVNGELQRCRKRVGGLFECTNWVLPEGAEITQYISQLLQSVPRPRAD